MQLHENIYRLRTARNMSQGDLAEALEVSRQSVSKWETGAAIPDLDKLIRMSQLFEVTLDDLVSDEEIQPAPPSPILTTVERVHQRKASGVAFGIVFLCLSVLVYWLFSRSDGFLNGFLLALPLSVCGVLCLCLKSRRALWCCWVLFISMAFRLFIGTSVDLLPFWYYFSPLVLAPSSSSIITVLIGLGSNAIAIALGVWTVLSYRELASRRGGKSNTFLIVGWSLTAIPELLDSICSTMRTYYSVRVLDYAAQTLYRYLSFILHWIHFAAIVFMLIVTVGTIRALRSRSSASK